MEIDGQTLIVIGAGASCPFGFPTGSELKQYVAASLSEKMRSEYAEIVANQESEGTSEDEFSNCDRTLRSDIETIFGTDETVLEEFGRRLAYSPYSSVDRFLDRLGREGEQELLNAGRRALVEAIRQHEDPTAIDRKLLGSCWIDTFIREILDVGEDPHQPHTDQYSILTFNYDRSFEYYVMRALSHDNDVTADARRRVSEMDIAHVYGKLGEIRSGETTDPNFLPYDEIDYASEDDRREEWETRAQRIRTMHETYVDGDDNRVSDDHNGKNDVWKYVPQLRDDDRLIFLGFGYDNLNLRRIGCDEIAEMDETPHLLGTGYGVRGVQREQIKRYFDRDPSKSHDWSHFGGPNEKTEDFVAELGVLQTDRQWWTATS